MLESLWDIWYALETDLVAFWSLLGTNAQSLSVLASFGTMLIWLFYAHLLYQAFRRQRQARILINQGWGKQIRSVALVSNMSHEPVYIQGVMLSMKLSDGRKFRNSVTDFDDATPWNASNDPREITRQGPLDQGSFMNLGTFETLLRQSGRQHDLIGDHSNDPVGQLGVDDFKITVICNYGPSGEAIGAQRRFLVKGEAHDQLFPDSLYSRRLSSRRSQRKLERWLQEQIEDAAAKRES